MTTALVTGASSGIGAEFCRNLAAQGHDLVVVARTPGPLEEIAARLRAAHGVVVEVLVADLADRAQLQRVADRVADPQRPIDLLVNNAGFGLKRSFLDSDLADEERTLDVLCRAVLVLAHAAGRAMRERGHGGILNVSSVAGFVSMGTYSAAKAWVTTFSQGLAGDLAAHGVVVTALCPGFTHTQFHQRAEMNMSRLPDALWLDAADVVQAGLDDLRRGRSLSVPGLPYKAVTTLLPFLPRRLVRDVTSGVGRRRRTH